MADGFEIATAFVKVSPDLDGFAEELESKLEEATAGAEGKVKVGADDAELDAVLDDAKAKLDELSGTRAEATAGLDAGELDEGAADAKAKLAEIDGTRAEATAGLDKGEFDESADDATARLRVLDESHVEATAALSTVGLDEAVDDATARLRVLAGTRADPVVGVEDAPAQESLAELQRQLAVLKAQKAGVEIDADASPADIKIAQVQAQIAALRNEKAVAALGLDGSEFDAGSEAATEKLAVLGGEDAAPKLLLDKAEFDAAADEADVKLDELKAKSATVSLGGSSGGGGGLFGTLLAGAGFGIGGLLPGVAGAGTGLGLLAGTGALAFGGITKALSAAHQASQNVGMTPQQVSAQNFSNSVQVQQAQQSVTQAKQQQAQDAVTSNDQIQQSEMNLASVTRNASASQVQALQSVTQAQQGVQQATYGLSEANYNLGQAYVQARENITALNDQLADSKLSVSAASLAVQQAQRQETLVNQSAYSTDLDRQQATLAVAQAKQQLQDATDNEASSQTAANLANSQGVDGSQTVVQAKQAQLAAQDSLTNAHNSAADAATNLKNTELNNAEQVKQAQMQVAQTQEQAAYQAQQDAQSVANAEQNVTNTIKEQQLQWAATQSTANQAANQFAKYMANLTPAGRSFVNQVLGMRGAFKGLETDAQNATLPGFTTFLQGVAALTPEIGSGVTQMGGAISKAFARMGTEMKTPQAVTVLNGLITNGMEFANTVLPSIGRAFGAIFDLGSSKGAATGLSNLVSGIFDGIAGFAKGLKPYIPELNDFFTAVGKIAKALGPAFASEIGEIATLLDPLAKFLNSKQGQPFIDAIAKIVAGLIAVKGLAKLLPGALGDAVGGAPGIILKVVGKPLKSMLSSAFKSAFGSAAKDGEQAAEDEVSNSGWLSGLAGGLKSKLSPIFKGAFGGAAKDGEEAAAGELGSGGGLSGMIGGIGNLLTGLPGKMSGVVEAIKGWGIWSSIASGATKVWTGIQAGFNLVMDANPIGLVALAIAGLVIGVVEAYKHFAWFRDGVKEAFGVIETGALWLWHNVFDPAWHGIEAGATWLYNNAIKPLWNNWIKPVFDDIKAGVDLVTHHWSTVWASMTAGFKAPVNFLIETVYDHGIARLWNDVVGAVGLNSIKLPVIPGLAHGGMVPGTDHGRDEVLIAARPEEGVLVPGAVRAIGGASAINALNSAHGGGGTGQAGHYSLGGIVSSFLSGGESTVKAIAALATGNTTAFVNALAPMIGTSASGTLGQVMVALPKTLVTDAAKAAIGMVGGSSGTGGAATSAAVASWMAAAVKAAGVPVSWIPDLELIASHESSDNPSAINMSDSNAAAGDPSRGILQLIGTTFSQYHVPGTSTNIFDPVANIAAGARYIGGRYGNPGNVPGIISLNSGGPYVGYDSGGWLPPGMTAAVNMTGKPEAVLTAEQSQALSQMAAGKGAQPPAQVTVNFYGTQMPGPEQMAEIERQLSLAVSGG